MKKYFQLAAIIATTVFGGLPALAATTAPVIVPVSSTTDLVTLIGKVITWALTIAGAIAVVFLIYGGITYITGGAKGADTGKVMIANTLIGVAVIALSYVLVQAVLTALGVGGAGSGGV